MSKITKLMLEYTVPPEGAVNNRYIGVYTTNEHNGCVLMMFELDDTEEHGCVQLQQWALPPEEEPVAYARKLLNLTIN